MSNCLFCYGLLEKEELEFHASCSKKIFGSYNPPELPYKEDDLEYLAKLIIQNQTTVTGVQRKLSLHLSKGEGKHTPKRFTIVGLWGGYILKPPSPEYPQLPEVEDLTMHLAEITKINIVPHSLIRMQSGNLAYITKRIDRVKKQKIHMEDICQLTERLTEDKYHGSYEQIAKTIKNYSINPGLDIVNFFEIVLFSFVTGNADMHLKNFSLIYHPHIGPILAPAYDLLSTKIVNPMDNEDLALTLNGKKKRINKKDFENAFTLLGLENKQQQSIFNKIIKAVPKWNEMIGKSFLTPDFKEQYISLIKERISLLIK